MLEAGGVPSFLRGQLLQTPPIPTQSFSGRTIIVTGANTGLGFETCKYLVQLKVSRLILACRNAVKADTARNALLALAPRGSTISIECWLLDMESNVSVLEFAKRADALSRLDGVMLNAGLWVKTFAFVEDNERTLKINVVSTFLLALLMLPVLRASATTHRIVPVITVVGSGLHIFGAHAQMQKAPRGAVFDALNDEKTADMAQRYQLSKLIVMQGVVEMAARISTSGKPLVVMNVANPGYCKTGLGATFRNAGAVVAEAIIARPAEQGARCMVNALADGSGSHGCYHSEGRVKPASPFVRSKEGRALGTNVFDELLERLEKVQPGVSKNI